MASLRIVSSFGIDGVGRSNTQKESVGRSAYKNGRLAACEYLPRPAYRRVVDSGTFKPYPFSSPEPGRNFRQQLKCRLATSRLEKTSRILSPEHTARKLAIYVGEVSYCQSHTYDYTDPH